jgi:heme/copper-type cytochrome/quinol oxidase subunit 2
MFRDLTKNEYLQDNARYYWTLAFIFLNVFGAGLYYFYEYRARHL